MVLGNRKDTMATNCTTHARRYATDSSAQETLIEMASLVGHKWHPVILHQLCVNDEQGFSELHETIDGVSNKMLSDSLSTLEARGLVDRAVVSDKPVRVRYSLTEDGHELESLLAEMLDWGTTHLDTQSNHQPTSTVVSAVESPTATATVASGSQSEEGLDQ